MRYYIASLRIPNECRLIVFAGGGRQMTILFSVIPDFSLGQEDPALKQIARNLEFYTFPLIDRFVGQLEFMLTDLYGTEIKLDRTWRPVTPNSTAPW